MNFNPLQFFGRKAATATSGDGKIGQATREAQSMGLWTGAFAGWVPRSCNPHLYEAMREAIPILDAGIGRLCTMDGIIVVEGKDEKLVKEIQRWMDTVPTNDIETGFQAFYASQGNEMYEQGVTLGEFVLDAKGRDVIGLRVADSKGVVFLRDDAGLRMFYQAPGSSPTVRNDGLEQVEALLRRGVRAGATAANVRALGYVELDPANIVGGVHNPEADNPYGTSVLRSMPFAAQILLKMQNATGRVWERFGDPIFHVQFKTKNRKIDATAAATRATNIVTSLATALAGKSRGNSVDISTGCAADDEIVIGVVGAGGEALEIEMPARHMLEQLVSGFGLPPWMLGITWSQATGIGEQQSVVVLQDSQTRFARRKPGLMRVVATMLRARGRTWNDGDWDLVQRLPNLMDETKKAQAAFLRAQTALMLGDSGQVTPPAADEGIDNGLRNAIEALLKAQTTAA